MRTTYRKIVMVGTYSRAVILPASWLREQGLDENANVRLEYDKEKVVIRRA